jgi:hypothetical protein
MTNIYSLLRCLDSKSSTAMFQHHPGGISIHTVAVMKEIGIFLGLFGKAYTSGLGQLGQSLIK